LVFREEILWLINIGTEFEVVDFSNVSMIKVLSEDQLEISLVIWDDLKLLYDSSKLLTGNMTVLGSIIVLKLGFNQDSLVYNQCSDGT